jgi:hypothetical protein
MSLYFTAPDEPKKITFGNLQDYDNFYADNCPYVKLPLVYSKPGRGGTKYNAFDYENEVLWFLSDDKEVLEIELNGEVEVRLI